MDAHLALAAVLLLATTPIAAHADCCVGDPSAVDLEPGVAPLTVSKDAPSGQLRLRWESHPRSDSQVWTGSLDSLWSSNSLQDIAGPPLVDDETLLPVPTENTHYIVSAACNGLFCTRGRDSEGRDRGTPFCDILERGYVLDDAARCLGVGQGVIRSRAEYDLFAACFAPGDAPDPPAQGAEALVWATDHANSACGTCLEFTCARGIGSELIVDRKGGPTGDCDAIHDGGSWARVPTAPIITIVEEMPPGPEHSPCY